MDEYEDKFQKICRIPELNIIGSKYWDEPTSRDNLILYAKKYSLDKIYIIFFNYGRVFFETHYNAC